MTYVCLQCRSLFNLSGSLPRLVCTGVVVIGDDGGRQEFPADGPIAAAFCPSCLVEYADGVNALIREAIEREAVRP